MNALIMYKPVITVIHSYIQNDCMRCLFKKNNKKNIRAIGIKYSAYISIRARTCVLDEQALSPKNSSASKRSSQLSSSCRLWQKSLWFGLGSFVQLSPWKQKKKTKCPITLSPRKCPQTAKTTNQLIFLQFTHLDD